MPHTSDNLRYVVGVCRFGSLVVIVSDIGVCAVLLGDDEADALTQMRVDFLNARKADLDIPLNEVVARLEHPRKTPLVRLDVPETGFRRRIWDALLTVPVGEVVTCAQLAALAGSPKAVRTAASACAANRLAVLVPCHRVVPASGGTGRYRWGGGAQGGYLDGRRRKAAKK